MIAPILITAGILGLMYANRQTVFSVPAGTPGGARAASGGGPRTSPPRPASFADLPIGTYVSVRGRTDQQTTYTGDVQNIEVGPMIYKITSKQRGFGPDEIWVYSGDVDVDGGLFGVLPGPDFMQSDIVRLSNETEWSEQSAPVYQPG
jgi:hypothetical protein